MRLRIPNPYYINPPTVAEKRQKNDLLALKMTHIKVKAVFLRILVRVTEITPLCINLYSEIARGETGRNALLSRLAGLIT
ncbi:hypothetical protein [Cronobacter dublinensis]|uniref:hypothetical protein n=1 Tax=Cronobacter dublinensis TaxID=413497 RepID=UPI00300DC870